MAIIDFITPPVFVDSTSGKPRPFGAPEYNVLRHNASLLDQLSYRARRAFTNQTYRLDAYGGDPSPLGKASFQYRTGLTTATFVLQSDTAGDSYKIYMNGVLVNTTATVNGTSTINVTISGMGFTDLQIVDCEVNVEYAGSDPNVYEWHDAYVSPYTGVATAILGAGPGVPTFGALTAANLNQLADAQIWLFERMNLVIQPLFMSQQYRNMTFWIADGETENREMLWSGSISKTNGATRLRIGVSYESVTNQDERLEVFVNTAHVANGPTWSAGDGGVYEFDIDISAYSADTPFNVRLDHVVYDSEAPGVRPHPSRLVLSDVWTTRSSYSYAALPAALSPRESLTFSQLQTRLNAIGTIISNAVVRIGNAPDAFNRARMFRHRPVLDEGQNAYFQELYIGRGRRAHDALWVRGKGLTIAYGTRKITRSLDEAYKYELQYSESISEGEVVQDKLIYHDQFAGLFPGVEFFILGEDLRFAAEQLR